MCIYLHYDCSHLTNQNIEALVICYFNCWWNGQTLLVKWQVWQSCVVGLLAKWLHWQLDVVANSILSCMDSRRAVHTAGLPKSWLTQGPALSQTLTWPEFAKCSNTVFIESETIRQETGSGEGVLGGKNSSRRVYVFNLLSYFLVDCY